ncbi:sugar diacid recognition domain-containing protein [Bacillus sp. V2I10]|uniref:sugar diacid recognition domain-containing protein n=1 Tax=Bacillus sp. V2I10 TaxID=3042276 RepID=UPI0035941BC5
MPSTHTSRGDVMLNTKIAQQIAEKKSKICGHNIVIIDCLGIINASIWKLNRLF